MSNQEPTYNSRFNRPNKNNSNKILNVLIGLVIVLIGITLVIIFTLDGKDGTKGRDNATKNEVNKESTTSKNNEQQDTSKNNEGSASDSKNNGNNGNATNTTNPTESKTEGTVTKTTSDDPLVKEVVVDVTWKPVGTAQKGDHVSNYSPGSVDWNEKVKALSATSGLSPDNMIVWFIKNGGSPHKSIGIISSNDKAEKYRVYLQWVDGAGWKAEKMEVLNKLEGSY